MIMPSTFDIIIIGIWLMVAGLCDLVIRRLKSNERRRERER